VTTHAAIEYCIILSSTYCMEPVLALQQAVPLMDSWKSSRPPGWPPSTQTAPCTMHTGFPRTRAHTTHEPLTDMSAVSSLLPRTSTTTVQYSASSRYSHSTQLLRTCSSCPCALCPALPCLLLQCSLVRSLVPTCLLTYFPTYLLTFLPGTRPSLTLAQPSPTLTTTTPLPICIATA
jgi:hypothetical protein